MGFDVDWFAEAYDASLRRQGVTPDPKPYRSVRHPSASWPVRSSHAASAVMSSNVSRSRPSTPGASSARS